MPIKNFCLLGLQGDLCNNRLIRLCTTVWPQYKLDNQSQWPPEGSLQYQILVDLDNFCHRLGKWSEINYVMAFWDLRSRPDLCSSCPSAQMLLARPQPHKDPAPHPSFPSPVSDPLDDLAKPSLCSPTSRRTPPPPRPYIPPPAPPPTLPIASWTRAHAPPMEQAPAAILPLREMAGAEGRVWVHVAFSLQDLSTDRKSVV